MADVERYGGGAIVLSDYDPRWAMQFEHERARVADLLGSVAIEIEHVGSTAVPGPAEKPIIDLLVTVQCLPDVRLDCLRALPRLDYGYLRKAEAWLPDEMLFRKTAAGRWTHHLHVMEPTSPRWEEFILIRDYLRVHPEIAHAYGQLKRALALVFEHDIAGYRDAKRPDVVKKARNFGPGLALVVTWRQGAVHAVPHSGSLPPRGALGRASAAPGKLLRLHPLARNQRLRF